jgi:chromosomal replication initiator protein
VEILWGICVSEDIMTGEAVALANPWEQIKARLTTRISARAYEDWVTRTAFDGSDAGVLRVMVPDQVTKTWMEQEYAEDIRDAIRELNLSVERVVYTMQPSGVTMSPSGPSQEPMFASPSSQLNGKFRFDNYVVGSCNQFAHAAARAVANSPSRTYNPLFIYGGSGMGKTHLMHSIGTALSEQYASMRVVYTSSERFMNEMINCIKTDRMPAFHRYYRSADVLLIDDIHILAGKERTQEEFFHTFNELYEHQKQIVVSSDTTPKSTPGLVDRLRSRFEWGLMVDIQPPDVETKMAILDKKAELEGVSLPEDVRVYIATKTKSNVRELEGALV